MTDKRVVEFLRTALRKLNQDWPRSVNLRTPHLNQSNYVLSSFDTYTSIPCPILMHHMCCGAAGGLKVIMTSSIPLGHPTNSFFHEIEDFHEARMRSTANSDVSSILSEAHVSIWKPPRTPNQYHCLLSFPVPVWNNNRVARQVSQD